MSRAIEERAFEEGIGPFVEGRLLAIKIEPRA